MADLLEVVLENLFLQQEPDFDIDELKTLSKRLEEIRPVLDDAERQMEKENIKEWVNKVRDVTYKIDDALIQRKREAVLSKIQVLDARETESEACGMAIVYMASFRLRRGLLRRERRSKVKKIGKIVNEIIDQMPLGLIASVPGNKMKGLGTNHMIDDVVIYGREKDREEVARMLLDNNNTNTNAFGEELDPTVVSVVGTKGIGKTTLARLLYSDERVVEYFGTRIWVWVPYRFNAGMVAKEIIESVTRKNFEHSDEESLQSLGDVLSGRRFFLVLDDVWEVPGGEWSKLRLAMPEGSRVLVTTHTPAVTEQMGCSLIHNLGSLGEEECWLLFSRRAFMGRPRKKCIKFESIGRKIAKRSNGSPLAAKILGNRMESRKTKLEWIHELETESGDREVDSFENLVETYTNLPPDLKRCFEFCSLFPSGCSIGKEMLVQLWIAEGFVSTKEEEEEEKVGSDHFNRFLSCNFVQDAGRDDEGNVIKCKMHDQVRDLARTRASSECFVMENELEESLPSQTRHASVICGESTDYIPSNFHKEAPRLRTLIFFGNPRKFKVSKDLFSGLRFLKVLDLSSTNITEVPSSVGKMEHLIYLNLSYTWIKELPPSICNLCLLQTLKLSCSSLCELPKKTRDLISLRHLEFEGTSVKYLPRGIGRLESIRKLSEFIIGTESDCSSISELANLNRLQGRLILSNLSKLSGREESQQAKMNEKEDLDSLVLDCKRHYSFLELERRKHVTFQQLQDMYEDTLESDESDAEVEVFEGIKPHENLKRLEVWNYNGSKYPNWMEASCKASLTNLVSLKLINCGSVEHLPPLEELSLLKFLHIAGMTKVKCIGWKFKFLKLECLIVEEMSSWEEWDLGVEENEMPCLRDLTLRNCPSLREIPSLPNNLKKLKITNCKPPLKNPSLPLLEHLVLMGNGGMLKSLPSAPHLKFLKIMLSPELTTLPVELGKLEKLEELTIQFCPKLKSLPQDLQQLKALQKLQIVGCPLLANRCEKPKGEDWEKINHICRIKIDNKVISG